MNPGPGLTLIIILFLLLTVVYSCDLACFLSTLTVINQFLDDYLVLFPQSM